MLARVLDAAEEAGRKRDDFTCALNVEVGFDDRQSANPDVLRGPAGWVVERLLGFTSAGFNAFNFLIVGEPRLEQMERIAAQVIPELRTAG